MRLQNDKYIRVLGASGGGACVPNLVDTFIFLGFFIVFVWSFQGV